MLNVQRSSPEAPAHGPANGRKGYVSVSKYAMAPGKAAKEACTGLVNINFRISQNHLCGATLIPFWSLIYSPILPSIPHFFHPGERKKNKGAQNFKHPFVDPDVYRPDRSTRVAHNGHRNDAALP